jgi:serine/threonine protein kinase
MSQDAGLARLLGATLDGKYRLEQRLGKGGMGVVFRATHLGTRRVVAVKVIAPRLVAEPEFVERFRREAEAAGRLRHPNVVDVTDFGVAGVEGSPVAYLVMEFLDGCSLEDILEQEGRLPLRWVAEILEQVCSAVDEAHQRGIVHRDLKPSNLWLEPNRRGGYTVKVLDFGLAKLAQTAEPEPASLPARADGAPTRPRAASTAVSPGEAGAAARAPFGLDALETRVRDLEEQETRISNGGTGGDPSSGDAPGLTRVGATLGTPLYMSPEQCRGESVDARSDIYSLGVIAYRMLAGRTPFEGTAPQLIRQHLEASPAPLQGAHKKVPLGVAELVASALAKDPAARPRSAASFGAALSARAEGAGAVLRLILMLYLEHFGPFYKLVAAALLPFALAAMGLGALLAFGGELSRAARNLSHLVLVLLFFFGIAPVGPVYAPIVAQLLAAPLRPLRLRPLFVAYRARLRTFLELMLPAAWFMLYMFAFLAFATAFRTSLRQLPRPWGMALPLLLTLGPLLLYLGYYLKNSSGFRFAGAVILMEGMDRPAALARSAALVRGTHRMLPGFELAFGVMMLPMVLLGAVVGGLLPRVLTGSAASAATLLAAAPAWTLLLALFVPLPLLGSALLYFKARQSLGEPLADVLRQFEARSLPSDYWQLRVEQRVRLLVESGG